MLNISRTKCLPLVMASVLVGSGGAYAADAREAADAGALIQQAEAVIGQMRADPDVDALLQQAHGVYIVPNFAQGAIVVGAWGGEGVMLSRADGGWSSPAFYDVAAVTAGAQIGFSEGAAAMLLMSEQAVSNFNTQESFSLDASADLTVMEFTAAEQASTRGDVVVWADTDGLYAGIAASVSDISWDDEKNAAYYGQPVSPAQVLSGEVRGESDVSITGALGH